MIQQGTYIDVADNSRIKSVKCIKVLGSSNPRYGRLGSLVLIAVSNRDVLRKLSKDNVKFGLIINICKNHRRPTGDFIRFEKNRCLIIDRNKSFAHSRVYYIIAKEVPIRAYSNLLSYAKAVV